MGACQHDDRPDCGKRDEREGSGLVLAKCRESHLPPVELLSLIFCLFYFSAGNLCKTSSYSVLEEHDTGVPSTTWSIVLW